MIVNLPWDARLGASRVWMELAEQWRALGHTVEKFALSDAFPGVRATRVTFALRQVFFIGKAAAFVRQNGHRFDLIDAMIGTLPFSKEELGFPGVIVARSVGLYRLYERFEQSVEERWPNPPRGKLLGRWLYRFTKRRLRAASECAVRNADLVNVPNEEEAASLRDELGVRKVVVQPYGLTESQRQTFEVGAAAIETRLTQQRVCFIGMWSARKGARDWPKIIARVREKIPAAQFRFLGTMLDAETIRAELGAAHSGAVEFISEYQPEQLPALLSDCTVGAFPSYVEGFGLAVIEQLAAGIPTVAYNTAGPRDILQPDLAELLVPIGDVEAFASVLVRIMQLDSTAYREVSDRSRKTAGAFSWTKIASDTLVAYRELIRAAASPVILVQPFSLGSAGGGARILRALVDTAPFAWRSICSSPIKPKPWRNELHLRSRPSWGPIEHSRLAAFPKASMKFFVRSFRTRLQARCKKLGARAIHAVPHAGGDFAEAHAVARALSLPFFISVHDDLAYTAGVPSTAREAAMRAAWQDASARFVISEALGKEYCRRYGDRAFEVVTDGLTSIGSPRSKADPDQLRIYFMGLFHMGYEPNLRALLEAIALFEQSHPAVSVSLTFRCEHIRAQALVGTKTVGVLPFADEAQVQRDLETADLLYLPIPFGATHENFARYSLSTKMVTYAGSGVPVLYHGPIGSAAFELLNQNSAALFATSLDPAEICRVLEEATPARRTEVAMRALDLARRQFMLADQSQKFWGTIAEKLTPA